MLNLLHIGLAMLDELAVLFVDLSTKVSHHATIAVLARRLKDDTRIIMATNSYEEVILQDLIIPGTRLSGLDDRHSAIGSALNEVVLVLPRGFVESSVFSR